MNLIVARPSHGRRANRLSTRRLRLRRLLARFEARWDQVLADYQARTTQDGVPSAGREETTDG